MAKARFKLHYHLEDSDNGRILKTGDKVRLKLEPSIYCTTGYMDCEILSFPSGCLRTSTGIDIPLGTLIDFYYL